MTAKEQRNQGTTNTTAHGNALRDLVYQLCLAANKQQVQREKDVGGKAVDVYFEDSPGFEGTKRYVIECKNYAKPLNQTQYEALYGSYVVRKSAFDRLIIVTENGVTESVRKAIDSQHQWVSHCTRQEFLYQLVKFGNYFDSLGGLTERSGLVHYYVPPLTSDKQDLEQLIREWIDGPSNQPMAILAGYGRGKSSFAQHLASVLTHAYRQNTFYRIPVYIRLGDLYSHQNLEALIIHHFVSQHQVTGLPYSLFEEMNTRGLLVIIFDGFDEMKHGMDYAEFEAIFHQIKALVQGKARIMVLGRPSALTSDNDAAVLFGSDNPPANPLMSAIPELNVTFEQQRISDMNDAQLASFVPRYMQYLNTTLPDTGNIPLSETLLAEKCTEILSVEGDFKNLLRRPVHADMMCKIVLHSPAAPLNAFSRYQLYQSFIEMLAIRELQKAARQSTQRDARLRFAYDVAWHFWPTQGHTGFSIQQLEDANLSLPAAIKPNDDILREMVVGSILEKKSNNLFFFAHRSFQEYLVAEYLLNTDAITLDISKINAELTQDIVAFLLESDKISALANNLFSLVGLLQKPLQPLLFKIMLDHVPSFRKLSLPDPDELNTLSDTQCFIQAYSTWDQIQKSLPLHRLHTPRDQGAALLGMLIASEYDYKAARTAVGYILAECLGLIFRGDYHREKQSNQIVIQDDKEYFWSRWLLLLRPQFDRNNEFDSLLIDTTYFGHGMLKLFPVLQDVIGTFHNEIQLRDLDAILRFALKEILKSDPNNRWETVEVRRKVIQYFRTQPNEESFVDKRTKQRTALVPRVLLQNSRLSIPKPYK